MSVYVNSTKIDMKIVDGNCTAGVHFWGTPCTTSTPFIYSIRADMLLFTVNLLDNLHSL